MKKQFILLVLFIANLQIYGQINKSDIVGKWIQFKSEKKDGSKIISKHNIDSIYFDVTITASSITFNSNSILKRDNNNIGYSVSGFTGKNSNLNLNYSIEGTLLKTSATSGYSVEKITKDTLIICQKVDGLQDDKLTRNYYLSEEKVVEREYKKVKDKKDITANPFFTPKLNGTLENEIFKSIQNEDINIDLIGTLTIFPKKNLITTEINYSNKDNPKKIKLITDVINNSFKKWDLEGFNEFESIKIPFILRSESKDISKGIKIIYFTNSIDDLNSNYGPTLSEMRKSQDLFDKGFDAFDKKNFLKAADYFAKAYETNPKNLDALYNVAISYYENGDKENACKIWKQLSDMGQTKGIDYYKTNCN